MIEFLYNFVFGPDFVSVLLAYGFTDDMASSVCVLANLECCIMAVFIFGSIIHFFISIFKRNRRAVL